MRKFDDRHGDFLTGLAEGQEELEFKMKMEEEELLFARQLKAQEKLKKQEQQHAAANVDLVRSSDEADDMMTDVASTSTSPRAMADSLPDVLGPLLSASSSPRLSRVIIFPPHLGSSFSVVPHPLIVPMITTMMSVVSMYEGNFQLNSNHMVFLYIVIIYILPVARSIGIAKGFLCLNEHLLPEPEKIFFWSRSGAYFGSVFEQWIGASEAARRRAEAVTRACPQTRTRVTGVIRPLGYHARKEIVNSVDR